ncbi:retrovirus-related pol polyprotein from transposon TNT 1-94 [Tanacetum coccineum]
MFVGAKTSIELPDDPNMPKLEDIVYLDDDKDVGAEADMNNLDAFMPVSPIPTTRIHKDHPVEQIIRDLNSAPQTRRMTKNLEEQRTQKGNSCMNDPSWIDAMQEKLRYSSYKKFRHLVAQGPHKKKEIDYEEAIAPMSRTVARIEAIRIFLAYASFKDFVVYQMDVKSAFLYGRIEEKVYVCQPLGFKDLDFPNRVYKVEKALYRLYQDPKACQDKYVIEILKKFGFTDVKTGSTPMETQKPLLKDEYGEEVDVHLYRSMIGSLMYLTSSRPDIMFAVCACARYQVNLKVSHLYVVKRIFRYLKGQPKLGLWYRKDSPFDLVAYTDSNYAGSSLDRNSIAGEADYVAASSCCGQVLWIQNQFLDYGDSNEKKLIQMIKNHTDKNVTDLLTKAFDAKMVNGEVQLQALVDRKKIIITEATLTLMGYEKLSQKLTFYKAFFSPQWKFLIHTILQCLSAKTTAWNEFSSTMASAIICLATNQKFNFSKYIFESMVKNLDSAGKFLMYPRFVQVFLDNQLEGMINHNKIYIAPSQTKKVFANMKRQGNDFSGRVTPLFSTMMVQAQQEQGEGIDMPTDPHHTPTIIPLSTLQPQRKKRPRKPKRKDTEITQSSVPIENVVNEAVYEERDDSLERATTTATGLDVEKDRGGGPRHQDTMGDTIAQTRNTKTAQAQEITSLKKRVKKLERKKRSRTHGLKRLYKVGLSARIDSSNDEASLVHDLDGYEVFVETKKPVVNAATTTSTIPVSAVKDLSDVDMSLAQALAELKSTKPKAITTAVTRPKAKGLVIQEQDQSSTPITSLKDKGKGIVVGVPLKMKKKDQVLFDEQEAIRLQAQFNKEERIVETDYELAQRLQAEEQEELTIKEKSKLFQQLLEKRRKHFAAKRAEERRNRPPTKAQQRSIICTYLKNMTGWKPKDFKTKSFANVQELFDKAIKRMLRDFDREDLETLWKLVKAKHGYTRPKEGYERVLCGDLKIMFEPDVEDMGRIIRIKSLLKVTANKVTTASVYYYC